MAESKLFNDLVQINGEQYRYIFENMYEAAFLVDVETGIIVDANLQATRMVGRRREEIVGKRHYLDDFPSSISKRTRWNFAKHVRMGPRARDLNFDGEILKKDGTIVPVNYSACNITIGGRRLLLGLFHDITERKQAGGALREAERRYKDLFRNSMNAVLVLDIGGSILETNRATKDLTGYTIKELSRLRVSDILTSEGSKVFKETRRCLLKHKAQLKHHELDIIRKDGVKVPVELITRLLSKVDKPIGFHTIIRDIGVQKQAKENIQFYISQIIKAREEERRRIACELHDETVQSLTALAYDIQAIGKQIGDISPESMLYTLNQLRNKTNSIQDGVRRLCQQLRIDVLEHLGLIPALEILIGELEYLHIVSHLEISGPVRRLKDEIELTLYRVVQEALNNTKKHSRATKVIICIEFKKNTVTMSVIDNGIGFKLPERWSDLAGTGKLGLIDIQERTRSIQGHLTITSEPTGTKLKIQVAA